MFIYQGETALLEPLMKRPTLLTVVASLAAGIVAALLTGLIDVTPSGLVGATWYGYPLTWLRRLIIAPQYYPWRFDWFNLVLDAAFWCAVAVAIGLSGLQLRRGLHRD
jgi:hypothetical protein